MKLADVLACMIDEEYVKLNVMSEDEVICTYMGHIDKTPYAFLEYQVRKISTGICNGLAIEIEKSDIVPVKGKIEFVDMIELFDTEDVINFELVTDEIVLHCSVTLDDVPTWMYFGVVTHVSMKTNTIALIIKEGLNIYYES